MLQYWYEWVWECFYTAAAATHSPTSVEILARHPPLLLLGGFFQDVEDRIL
jgi:hypothetical protein